jgi:hypothetical protein
MKYFPIFLHPKRALFLLAGCLVLAGCKSKQPLESSVSDAQYTVAAYVWPSCHDEERSREVFWGEGIGEWEIIQRNTPRFEGHYQPRLPLWGYEMDDDPVAVAKKIEAATDHGVNAFIYDWFWYDGKPYLEEALNEGFLKAKNNQKMKFYIMWANHDVPGNMWNPYRYKTDSLIWKGSVDWDNYKIIVERVIRQYFTQPNYFQINGEPVFSIYDLKNFLQSFDGKEGAKEAVDYFRKEVQSAGFPGLHLQLVGKYDTIDVTNPVLFADKPADGMNPREMLSYLGINSVTLYNMAPRGNIEDYLVYGERGVRLRNNWDALLDIPFFPVVSAGWDNTPRYPAMGKSAVVHFNNTPISFAAYLQKAREYTDSHPEQEKLIIINAWNEWVEGSYLEPDMLWGYGYLEAVRDVMNGKFERY